MYATKGFVAHSVFSDNTVGVIAPIGEISTQSLTYAREKGEYVSTAAPKQTYHSFLSSNNGTVIPVPTSMAEHILTVSKRLYDRTIESAGQQYADELLQDLLETFSASAEDFACGAMITDGTFWMPEWVSWTTKNLDQIPVDNSVRVWFVDDSFKLQYDEYEITVVPPTDRLDDFFKTGAEVDLMLKAFDTSANIARIQAAKNGIPETTIRSQAYNYIDPYNAQHIVPSNWGLLINGEAGNNVDAISDTLVDYILENSTHTKEEWTKILPDLFKRTEYVLVPRWDLEALPNRLPAPGVYSPVATLTDSLAMMKAFIAGYQEAHINSHAQVLPHQYKSLQLLVIGGPDNRNAKYKFTDLFADYIDVSTQSLDFGRMSVYTKQFLLQLESHVLLAETVSEFSSIPQGYTRTKRNGKLYLVRNYDNINYLVATKSNFNVT